MNVGPPDSGRIEINGSAPASYPWSDVFPRSSIKLEAFPAFGFTFSNWGGSVWQGTSNPFHLYLDCSKYVWAYFAPITAETKKVYFPHVESQKGAPAGVWETEICVINTSGTQTINGVFRAYNDAGALIHQIDETLLPRGRREITVGNEFNNPASIGYIIFESYSDTVVGYMKFYVEGRYRAAIPAVSSVNSGDIYISHIASDSNWWTKIGLLNTTSSPRDLTIEFDNGETRPVNLPAKEHKAFTIRSLFGGQPQDNIKSAVIRDANGVAGLELFTSDPWNLMSGILLNDETTTHMYYPHIASGGPLGWGTGIVAYNPSDTDCEITVTPYTEEGIPLTPASDIIYGKDRYFGLVDLDIPLPVGTAWVMIEADSPITGFELFTRENLMAGYTGVEISGTEGIFAKLEKDGTTGIAFVNVGVGAAAVTLSAYSNSGTAVATKTIYLDAYEKVVDFAEDIFEGNNISNATYITYSSDREVVGFQLNASFDNMMLDALPGRLAN